MEEGPGCVCISCDQVAADARRRWRRSPASRLSFRIGVSCVHNSPGRIHLIRRHICASANKRHLLKGCVARCACWCSYPPRSHIARPLARHQCGFQGSSASRRRNHNRTQHAREVPSNLETACLCAMPPSHMTVHIIGTCVNDSPVASGRGM